MWDLSDDTGDMVDIGLYIQEYCNSIWGKQAPVEIWAFIAASSEDWSCLNPWNLLWNNIHCSHAEPW